MDIEKANLDISNIKNPLVFIFDLLTNIEISDFELSIILKLFLKHHSEIAFTYNLKEIFIEELIYYNNSWLVLTEFYKLIHEKISLLMILKKWYDIYNSKSLWKLSPYEQIQYLINKKEYFLSIYDCSHGGFPYHFKVIETLNDSKCCREEVLNNVKERLELILKLFGKKIFECVNIPLIKVSEFYNLTNEQIYIYLKIIYERMNELLNQTIYLFQSYNINFQKLDNLLNHIIVNINSDTESDIDDFFN
jgi:hypothetical protein